jgi:hypothetical protein
MGNPIAGRDCYVEDQEELIATLRTTGDDITVMENPIIVR